MSSALHQSSSRYPDQFRNKSILVIDDDPIFLELLVTWLTTAGFCPVSAHDGSEGLALFQIQSFDLILTDLIMPEIDGFEVLSTVAGKSPEVPIIIISGAAGINESIQALRLGAWDFLTKPFDSPQLFHRIHKALERAELLKGNARYRQNLEAMVERRTSELRARSRELESANLNLHREIQARRQIENDLMQANERWQVTFDSMPDFISIHDQEFTIVQANRALIKFLGKSPEEVIGAKCCQIFHGTSTPWMGCPHRQLLVSGLSQSCEINDSYIGIPLLVTVAPIKKDGRIVGSIHIAKDISQQKKLEEERQKNINLESIAVLCGGLAHDFNNLLTALGGYIDLAAMEKHRERLPQWLDQAKMVTNLAAELTKQLLTFSKGGTPVLKQVTVPVLIEKSIHQLKKTLAHVRVKLKIDDGLWPIKADGDQLLTVFRNLCHNAAEAMPAGGMLTIEAHNVPSGTAGSHIAQNAIILNFIDEGVGIDEEIIDKIFNPYFTTSAKGSIKGKGLGLSLCHSIISKHHGHIAVSSQVNHGTTVSMYLPAAGEIPSNDSREDQP